MDYHNTVGQGAGNFMPYHPFVATENMGSFEQPPYDAEKHVSLYFHIPN